MKRALRNLPNAPELANPPPTIEVFHQNVYLSHTKDLIYIANEQPDTPAKDDEKVWKYLLFTSHGQLHL